MKITCLKSTAPLFVSIKCQNSQSLLILTGLLPAAVIQTKTTCQPFNRLNLRISRLKRIASLMRPDKIVTACNRKTRKTSLRSTEPMHNSNQSHFLNFILLVAAFISSGCGLSQDNSSFPRPLKPVSGSISLDGKPLPGVVITFLPEQEGGSLSIGETDAQGVYRLSYVGMPGCAPGDYTVVLSYKTLADGKPLSNELRSGLILPEEALKAPERMPAKYAPGSSELKAAVPESGGVIDFKLTGPLGQARQP